MTNKNNDKLELAKDIIAYASILMKFHGDGLLENQSLFVHSLNIVGFRTQTGKEFTQMSFRKMFERFTPEERREIISEFNIGHREHQLLSAMFTYTK